LGLPYRDAARKMAKLLGFSPYLGFLFLCYPDPGYTPKRMLAKGKACTTV